MDLRTTKVTFLHPKIAKILFCYMRKKEITKLWLLWSVPEAHHLSLSILLFFHSLFRVCRHEHVMYFPSSCNTDNRFQLYREFIADFRSLLLHSHPWWKIAFKSASHSAPLKSDVMLSSAQHFHLLYVHFLLFNW